ncbi:hypothetical protein H4696_004265 [Amycolatopsis lexingtonensis]|uniref:Uncharacterized protein n=1 Tax=Amycolatopsis lexingtonensis TaxID=218822 RepID=A0ABR9I1Y1_9PSEU|nr:hypothetical protein [Amycolatopsis lexingtonensis]
MLQPEPHAQDRQPTFCLNRLKPRSSRTNRLPRPAPVTDGSAPPHARSASRAGAPRPIVHRGWLGRRRFCASTLTVGQSRPCPSADRASRLARVIGGSVRPWSRSASRVGAPTRIVHRGWLGRRRFCASTLTVGQSRRCPNADRASRLAPAVGGSASPLTVGWLRTCRAGTPTPIASRGFCASTLTARRALAEPVPTTDVPAPIALSGHRRFCAPTPTTAHPRTRRARVPTPRLGREHRPSSQDSRPIDSPRTRPDRLGAPASAAHLSTANGHPSQTEAPCLNTSTPAGAATGHNSTTYR